MNCGNVCGPGEQGGKNRKDVPHKGANVQKHERKSMLSGNIELQVFVGPRAQGRDEAGRSSH